MTVAPRKYQPRRQRNDVPDVGHDTTLTVLKSIQGKEGRWTITDSHLSPDNERLVGCPQIIHIFPLTCLLQDYILFYREPLTSSNKAIFTDSIEDAHCPYGQHARLVTNTNTYKFREPPGAQPSLGLG
jgi:hypothetical protein